MSAWFQERYPHLSIGAWSSSGVVQPIVDFWRFDEQVYESTVKSGEECPRIIQDTMKWVTEVGKQRDAGDSGTVIDQTLDESTQGMRTDDWMFYYADIFVEGVQYGHRTEMCELLNYLEYQSDPNALVLGMAAWGGNVAGVTPPFYD
jgi:hypothetical protein